MLYVRFPLFLAFKLNCAAALSGWRKLLSAWILITPINLMLAIVSLTALYLMIKFAPHRSFRTLSVRFCAFPKGPLFGQHLHRTIVAVTEARGRLPA